MRAVDRSPPPPEAGAAASPGRRLRGNPPAPKTVDYSGVEFDIFADLLSFYLRTANLLVSRDLDAQMTPLAVAGGTGKISTLVLVDANPGIRPSVLAHLILKDRSAMGKLLEQLERAGLVVQRVSAAERRARELYLTPKGQALAERVRAGAKVQSEAFFSVLSGEERASLLRVLKKLYHAYVDAAPEAAHDRG
jgi:DNA-binding MarR family transcriptional regulator